MGICISCESKDDTTAKLIQIDGTLQEFSYPVKVSYILLNNPECFICNSDEMDFDDVVSDLRDDEELQPGQLYFALPLRRLGQRLQCEEMAALAVKASSALMKIGGINVGESDLKSSRKVMDSGNVIEKGSRKRSGCGFGRRRKFTASLSTIAE